MDRDYFLESLYPLQDHVLKQVSEAETEFYLSGGTGASRGYLDHRFSEDLDLFVNDNELFPLWCDRLLEALNAVSDWTLEVNQRADRFTRLTLWEGDLTLKIELINDVPSRVGSVRPHPVLGRLDSAENIFANKISALIGRSEPKDLADVWGFSALMKLPIQDAIQGAHGKAAGIFPADLARILCSVTSDDWSLIRWHHSPTFEDYRSTLAALGEALLLPD